MNTHYLTQAMSVFILQSDNRKSTPCIIIAKFFIKILSRHFIINQQLSKFMLKKNKFKNSS